jgi:hypothetical protein
MFQQLLDLRRQIVVDICESWKGRGYRKGRREEVDKLWLYMIQGRSQILKRRDQTLLWVCRFCHQFHTGGRSVHITCLAEIVHAFYHCPYFEFRHRPIEQCELFKLTKRSQYWRYSEELRSASIIFRIPPKSLFHWCKHVCVWQESMNFSRSVPTRLQ